MKAKKTVLATIIIVTFMSMSIMSIVCAIEWLTVTTITGSADQTSKSFNITAQEWRLQWSYTPDPQFPSLTFFGVLVYPEVEDASFIDSFYVNGSTKTSGIEVINAGIGNYHLEILDANIPGYTIVVQQYGGTVSNPPKGDSIFDYFTNVVFVVLVIAVFAVAVAVILLKRRKSPRSTQMPLSPPPAAIILHI